MKKVVRSKSKKTSSLNHPFVTEIILRIAPKIGAEVLVEPEYGYVGCVIFRNGRRVLFRGTNLNINPLGSSEIARDKGYADFFLRHFGYNTPTNQTFFSEQLNAHLKIKRTIDDGFEYARNIGFPVIVKPNNLSQGTLVVKVYNKKEFYLAAKKIFRRTSVLLVQKFYAGNDYRIVVLDNEVLSAYQRIPLQVVGDGKATVEGLLRRKQRVFNKTGRDTIIDTDDFRIKQNLKRLKYTFLSIPKRDEKIYLLDNANLSTGGDAVDVTERVHPRFRNLAVRITKDMGLRICGVDIIVSGDIKEPSDSYVIVEINSAPGLDNYAAIGEKQRRIVDDLYLKVLKALEGD